MQPGTFELLILVFIFLGLQAWWIIPIVIKNNKLNNRGKDLREEIKQLEKLYKKINDIRKYFLSIGKDENYEESLKILSSIKNEVNDFFDNVIVNDEDIIIKKNRLELLNMLCKTFDNYFNFSKIEA